MVYIIVVLQTLLSKNYFNLFGLPLGIVISDDILREKKITQIILSNAILMINSIFSDSKFKFSQSFAYISYEKYIKYRMYTSYSSTN